MQRTISSIIAEVEKETTVAGQVKVLKANSNSTLKMIIGYAMDPLVHFLLPPGDPPYRPLPKAADAEAAFWNEARKMIYLVSSSKEGKSLNQNKREQIFIGMLESIDPDDALLLLRIKDKKLNIKPEAVKKAFPGISKDW